MQDHIFNVNCTVRKRNGSQDSFDVNKILTGINKSAQRSEPKFSKLTPEEQEKFLAVLEQLFFTYEIKDGDVLETSFIEKLVGNALGSISKSIQTTYTDYNLWKSKFADSWCKVKSEVDEVNFRGDKSNANTNSAYVSTKRCIGYNIFNKELYQLNFMSPLELRVCRDGYIYIHDMSARNDTFNCMLYRMEDVMTGGFEMGDMWYTEPNDLEVAFKDLLAVTKTAAAQQYGGFTIPRIDTLLAKYAEKSYKKYMREYIKFAPGSAQLSEAAVLADQYAMYKVQRDMEQGFQAMEYDLNTIGSSRGDYPFVTITFGLDTSKFGKMASKTAAIVRAGGQGKPGHKKIVAFPKLVFLYDENLHSEGKECYDVYEDVVKCQAKAMYPDMLSLTGEGYVSSIYKKYKLPISPMGCVDPLEVVTYKLNKQLFVESIARLYGRIRECMVEKIQPGLDKRYTYFDTSYMDLEIYDTKLGFVKMNKMIRNYNENDWYQVVLDSGRYIQVTHDHPFETENRGVVHACDLIPGEDKIRVNYECYSEETETCPDDLAWFLGLMLCDGCYQCGVVVSIAAEGEDEIQNMFLEVVDRYYKLPTRVKLQERGPKGTYKDLKILSDGSGALEKLKRDFADLFGGINKKDRQIPPEVFRWNRSAKMAFLAGMMDADGYIARAGDDTNTGHACIGSTNRELAIQQTMLIQSLGMPVRVYANHYKKDSSKIRHKVEFYATHELGAYITCAKKYQAIPAEPGAFADLNQIRTVVRVDKVDDPEEHYSYDVETASGHFETSGIYSHNCRAFLSPWFIKGGMNPADDDDVPVFEGRANIGAVSLNLPMIYQQAKEENKDFYETLDYYLEMIRNIHQRTYEYLGKMKAGCNPMVFCQGGAYGGYLKPDESIAPIIKSWTASFGITALNELQVLHNGKTINEDGEFALEVLTYINKQVEKFKKLDGKLYAIYSTPAESLCGTQVKQFRKKYGIIKGVSDKDYFTNSTHCPVYAHMTPFEKQDSEKRFWDLSNGGHIQYVRYNSDKNLEAFDTINKRGMKMGFYQGHNLDKCYCEDCGYEQLDMKICPKCGSKNITEVNRVCGYLGYSKIKGDTRMNDAKLAEIADRVSM